MTMSVFAALCAGLVFPVTMTLAGLMDLITMKIRNGLVLFLLLAYALIIPFAGFEVATIGASLAAGLAVFACGFVFFALGWVGGGDVKLAAVTALWVGADQTLPFVVWTAVFGGALTLGLLQFRMLALPLSWHQRPWIERLHVRETGVPYGVAMAAAALVVFPGTPWTASLS